MKLHLIGIILMIVIVFLMLHLYGCCRNPYYCGGEARTPKAYLITATAEVNGAKNCIASAPGETIPCDADNCGKSSYVEIMDTNSFVNQIDTGSVDAVGYHPQ